MNKKAIKYLYQKDNPTEMEIYLAPDSKAYELHKEKKMEELNKHLDLCLIAEGRWRK